MVGINVPIPVPAAHFSFGGWKSSLYGDLHAHMLALPLTLIVAPPSAKNV